VAGRRALAAHDEAQVGIDIEADALHASHSGRRVVQRHARGTSHLGQQQQVARAAVDQRIDHLARQRDLPAVERTIGLVVQRRSWQCEHRHRGVAIARAHGALDRLQHVAVHRVLGIVGPASSVLVVATADLGARADDLDLVAHQR